jgi:DNA replication protein DnaC
MRSTGVPVNKVSARLDKCPDIAPRLITHLRNWAKEPNGFLILSGVPGSGKSYLAAATLAEIAINMNLLPKSAKWCSEYKLIANVKKEYGNLVITPEGKEILYKKILVLDDMGLAPADPSPIEAVRHLFFERHDRCFPTIITTMMDFNAIEERYHGHVTSRIEESNDIIVMKSVDLRKTGSIKARTPQISTAT